jgi:Predicted metalloendopeptidase
LALKDLKWMGKETKEKALIKLEKLNVKIGYPEVGKDYTGLNFF